jgi:hypothetical protein
MVSSRSEAPMRRTGPGSASPRSRPDTSRCYRTCMSQTSEGERRGRGGRRGRGREIRIPTCANFWPQRSTTPPSMHPCNPFAAPCSCALANALPQRRLRSAASPHPKSMLDPTRVAPHARPTRASPRQFKIDPRRAALRPPPGRCAEECKPWHTHAASAMPTLVAYLNWM